ncbi:MAG: DUF996 domain-containing protein [Nitrososphaerota archaeon]
MIIVLVAMRGFSRIYNEVKIFKNFLIGFIFEIIASSFFIVTIFLLLSEFYFLKYLWFLGFSYSAITRILFIIGVIFLILIIATIFYKKSFNLLAQKSKVDLFNTVGVLLLIGTIFLPITLIGGISLLIAWIIAIIGFFSIKQT